MFYAIGTTQSSFLLISIESIESVVTAVADIKIFPSIFVFFVFVGLSMPFYIDDFKLYTA